MNTNPIVSVIIPTFNRDKPLLNAINSIANQSFQDFELIVVDDGSTDATRELILSLYNPKIRYFYQENQGLPAAWNSGIERSNGKYITFLDSDDTWLSDKLKFQVAFLEELYKKYPGCVTGHFIHALNGRKTRIIPQPAHTSLKAIMWKNILHLGTTFMCSREVFYEVGYFDANLRRSQDTDWLIRFRKKFEIGIVPEALAVFNQHLTRSGETMENSLLYFLEKHKTDMLEFGNTFYRRKAAIIYRDLAFQFSRENNLVKAREYAGKSVLTYPMFSPGLFLVLIDVHLGTRFKRKADSVRYPGAFK